MQKTARRGAILTVLLVLIGLQAVADGALFVSSEPFGAEIRIDDGRSRGQTPAILELAPGVYQIELERDGHEPTIVEAVVNDGQTSSVSANLRANYVIAEFPEESGASAVLPDGGYQLRRDARGYAIDPLYPREGRIRAVKLLVPTTVAVAIGSTLFRLVAPTEDPTLAIAPVATLQAVAVGLVAVSAAQEVRRERYFSAWRPPEAPYRGIAARAQYAAAVQALELADLEDALSRLLQLAVDHPDAPQVPEALFTAGRLEAIGGNAGRAIEIFQRLIRDYPVVTHYDRTLVQLAQAHAATGDREAARAALDRIVFADDRVTPEAVKSLYSLFSDPR